MINEDVSLSILSVLIQLGNELLIPNKYALGFPQIIQLLVILAGHGSGNGHSYLFQATAIWLEFCANTLVENNDNSSFLQSLISTTETLSFFHSNILEASIYLLAYINDILIALKYLSTNEQSILKSDESDDEDDENTSNDSKKSLSTTFQTEYDPNK